MNILIDGYNLALKNPTGIGSYAVNLAHNICEMGHDVSVLYGLRHGSQKFPSNVSFYQLLANEGELRPLGLAGWLRHGPRSLLSCLAGKGRQPRAIRTDFELLNRGLARNLPASAGTYNLPHVFSVSSSFAAVSGRALPLGPPLSGDSVDVLHLTFPLPISGGKVPTVVTAHDLVPLKLPLSTSINLRHYVNMTRASLDSADLIFSVSERTKLDVMEIFGIDEKKIHVTYQPAGISQAIAEFADKVTDTLLEALSLERGKYFLYYGAIEPKKNVLRLVQSFMKARTDCKLVVLGKDGWLYEKEEEFFRALNGNPKIVRIPYSDFIDVVTLLKGARALLFPSLYEGFGLPVLEAMQVGTPVVTSPMGSLPEVGGDAVHYVDPYSTSEIVRAIEDFSTRTDFASMIEKGRNQAEKFSEERYRERLEAGYSRLSA